MIWHLLADQPEIALFASLAIGFFIGSFKLGPLQLGGVCGTLIVALILGQSGARISPDLKNIAFALFIFALGFTGGPQFFANIGRGWRYGLLSVVEIVSVLLRINLRAEAERVWRELGGGDALDEGQRLAAPALVGRAFRVGPAAGAT